MAIKEKPKKEDPPLKMHAERITSATYASFRNAMGGSVPEWKDLQPKEQRAWMVASRNAVLQCKLVNAPEAEGVTPHDVPEPPKTQPEGVFAKKEG